MQRQAIGRRSVRLLAVRSRLTSPGSVLGSAVLPGCARTAAGRPSASAGKPYTTTGRPRLPSRLWPKRASGQERPLAVAAADVVERLPALGQMALCQPALDALLALAQPVHRLVHGAEASSPASVLSPSSRAVASLDAGRGTHSAISAIALSRRGESLREALSRGRALLAAADDKEQPPPPQEAAGIPVDSDHVAIVLDTSGSMMPLWRNVMSEMSNVLSQYPQLKGFQVLSDQGEYLHPKTRGNWISDTPANRRTALRKMSTWRAYSASNPAPGILQAVRDLYAPGRRMAVFVFGDDYQGGGLP